jgi:hypothetical protein
MSKTDLRPTGKQGFFIPYGYLVVAAVLIIIGLIIFLVHMHKSPSKLGKVSDQSQQAPSGESKQKINNFYDCYESGGSYRPGKPGHCVENGKSYTQPQEFTPANVRGGAKVPAGARGVVYSIASKNFYDCRQKASADNPLVATTDVLSIARGQFVYIGVSCDQGYREVIAKQKDGSWQRVSKTTNVIPCKTVKKYHIPRSLFLNSGKLGNQAALCQVSDDTTKPIPKSSSQSDASSGAKPESDQRGNT